MNIKKTIGINENLSDETYVIKIGIKLLLALRFSSKIHVIKIIKPISNTFNKGLVVKIFLKLNEYKNIKLKPIQLNGIENIW